MEISYKRLWKLLIDKDMKKKLNRKFFFCEGGEGDKGVKGDKGIKGVKGLQPLQPLQPLQSATKRYTPVTL